MLSTDKYVLFLRQLLSSASDGAFIMSSDQRILHWNQSAQMILGYTPDEVIGRFRHEVLNGSENKKDKANCRGWPEITALLSGNSVGNFDACVHTKSGQMCWINVSTLICPTFNADTVPVILHLFRDITQNKRNEQFISQVVSAVELLQADLSKDHRLEIDKIHIKDLTTREREVLALLTQGAKTHNIADALSISLHTTRNHIRNILRKLDVNSRLEAVIYAFKHGLVGD